MEPAKQFKFLDLPAELRNHIYELHFKSSKAFICDKDAQYYPPSLLLVCKTIYSEAVLTYYRFATFYVLRPRDLAWFLNIPEHFQEAVTDVRMSLHGFGIRAVDFIQHSRHRVDEAGMKLKKGVIHVVAYSGVLGIIVWTNGFKRAGKDDLHDLYREYKRAEVVSDRDRQRRVSKNATLTA